MASQSGTKHQSVEFRMKVIKDWMDSGTPMKQLVLKYDLSTVRIVKKWLAWYREYGEPKRPISNKRKGRPKARDENLEQKVKRLEMEHDLLKKSTSC